MVEELTGEHWITDGMVEFADGDIGDKNHEAVVIESMMYRIADKLGIEYRETEEWDDYKERVAEQNEWDPEKDDHPDTYWEFFNRIAREAGVSDEELEIADGHGDARLYAAVHWGWILVVDKSFWAWTFTQDDRDAILSGIGDINREVGDDYEIEIHVHSTGESYTMTIAELEAYRDERHPPIAADLANWAATNYFRAADAAIMHPHYKGHIGD